MLRCLICLALGALIAGCSHQPAATAGIGQTAPNQVSFDGHYEGSVQVTGVATGVDRHQCATNPRLSLEVIHNTFSYIQSHPDVAGEANTPTYDPKAMAVTYSGTIAPNGLITGNSGLGGSIQGTVSGTHMSGTINGLLCGYSFTADRV
jgi:hypothetical protein